MASELGSSGNGTLHRFDVMLDDTHAEASTAFRRITPARKVLVKPRLEFVRHTDPDVFHHGFENDRLRNVRRVCCHAEIHASAGEHIFAGVRKKVEQHFLHLRPIVPDVAPQVTDAAR